MSVCSLLLLSLLAPLETHDQANTLFRELCQTGLAVSAADKAPLPPPTMADGLNGRAQQKVILGVVGQADQLEEFLRKSVVSSQVLKIRAIKPSDPAAPAYGIDFWFIAYGDLETVAKQEFGKGLLDSSQKDRKVHVLTAADLNKRKLAAKDHERFSHSTATLLERVQLSTTSYLVMSRTSESIVVAARLDDRFNGDKEFPNQWRSQTDLNGRIVLGPAQPYVCSASYIKITRLADPAGALFVECHQLYNEPRGWFNGGNLLRSKVPTVVQSEIRNFRKVLNKPKSGK